ncbi:VOC family protein [uncultured Limosilactobacillus sp.]|uniref:VOC family protein n=1 Tax=uncultured Limosilactobacillus sp. TaxID=2837629 RepID=UPI0025F082BD|nr:VOC family protein [uncultured Limosilactobacillus sp.]
MKMRRIDHIVLTVNDLEASRRFYHEVFDMPIVNNQAKQNEHIVTLRCGHQLIRLQDTKRPQNQLQASHPTPGSADLCLVSGDDPEDVLHHLRSYYVDVIRKPQPNQGAEGDMTSLYLRDPDQNLIEICFYKNK